MIFPRPSGLTKVAHHRLSYKKHSLQIDVENGVEILFRHVPAVRAFLEACIVDEDVHLSEGCDSLFDKSPAVGDDPHVGLKRSRASLCSGNAFHDFVRPRLVLAIADRYIGAFLRQTLRYCTSDSLITARYSSNFSRQSICQDSSSRFSSSRKRNLVRTRFLAS
jgi:hypothetical protein